MKILHLSDTHGYHDKLSNLPEADILIHSGDFTMNGNESEAIDFMNWLCNLSYPHKIFICGNHDDCLFGANIDGLDSNVHYLCNSGVEIDGMNFYGVPMFTYDCITNRQNQNYDYIPTDTDVLITHSPAYGILDFDDGINYGSEELLARISSLHLKAHLFGHVHAQYGTIVSDGKIFSNGAVMKSDSYHLNPPQEIII
ncbi:MAG: metallophosphatase domain-containing protein [Muribaculaceae bacterium]|nr:metallophosphatase domain-containing protein [Muribaculaceae bacterium]